MNKYTNIKTGLTQEEVEENRKNYGTNVILPTNNTTFIQKFIESLGDPIIRILLIALGIKLVFLIREFDWFETIGIVIAIFVASLISTISEYGSETAFIKLQNEASKIKCRVKRNNKEEEINIDKIVVGDIIMLEQGDKIPADGILLEGILSVDESSLNGETKEVYKEPKTNKNILYRGTVVYSNKGIMIATKVGNNSLYGKLAAELSEKSGESPLKLKLRELAKFISKIGYVGSALVSLSYLFSVIVIQNNFQITEILETITNGRLMLGYILYAMTLCVTVIVVAVPEGLPMMITLVLSSNMKRMLKNNVLVRKLVGIETAGSLNILFTDKTGTLTKGKLDVIGYVSPTLKEYQTEQELIKYPIYDYIKNSIIYNNQSIKEQDKIIGGNTTDRAMINFIKTSTIKSHPIIKEKQFNSTDKYSSVTVDIKEKKKFIKGAPEKIIPYCTNYYNDYGYKEKNIDIKKINSQISKYTRTGIRVIALAVNETYNVENTFNNLTFLGLILIKDEIRKESKEGIKLVEEAGIHVVMMTGDNKETAYSIAREVGIIKTEQDLILTSDELDKLTDEEIEKIIPNLRVVSRALPLDKSRLVRITEQMGLVVGMTGDGVNDAPALKKANIGFAMGSGTEVSKEASDIVILDDNIMSIANAILYGRTIFKSIRKFIIIQLTINMCAMSLSIIGPFIGISTPVTVIQMLWINMVMDTLAGLAYAFEPALLEYMKEKPKKLNDSIINKYMLNEIIVTGLYSSILCLLFLKLPIIKTIYKTEDHLMTAFFGLFIFIDIFNSFNARTNRINIVANILKNKVFLGIICGIALVQILLMYFGGTVFRTVGLSFIEFQFMIILASTVIPIDWLRKYYLKNKHKNTKNNNYLSV